MVLSRANAKVAFDHIMDEVLGRDNESGLKKALLRERLYESMRPSANHFPDEQKRVMLENAVQAVPELRNVKVTTNALEAQNGGSPLDFVAYLTLLKDAATNYDDARGKNKPKVEV